MKCQMLAIPWKILKKVRDEVAHYEKVRDEVKLAGGDLVELKRFEPAMRHLLDM